MTYSDEQREAIESPAPTLVVNAAAGSGKTTMLEGYASARPEERMLYLAFNSSVAKEAAARFPRNVMCRTPHSLAFSEYGADFRHKLGSSRAREVMDYLLTVMRPAEMGSDKYSFAQAALRLVSGYFASESLNPNITAAEVDASGCDPLGRMDAGALVKAAQHIWLAMQDPGESMVLMPHDGYLKLYQLAMPDLGAFDVILLDEAQDTNPCVLNIFKAQDTRKVLVGDRHQNIYGFRRSVNAMDLVKGQRLFLSKSFRFGERQAAIANAILGTFCGEEEMRIQGLGGNASKQSTMCYLHRTNAGLFGRAVELLTQGKRVHFLGGVSSYGFDQIVETWKLSAGRNDIKDPFIRRFKSYKELSDYAESVDDRELKSRMAIIKQHGSSVADKVGQMLRVDVPAEQAHATLSTAHRAKGLEWDHVVMGDDFPQMMVDNKPRTQVGIIGSGEKPLAVEEANLCYVSVTRARHRLTEAPALGDFMKWAKLH